MNATTTWERLVEAEDALEGRERALVNLLTINWVLVAVMVSSAASSLPPVIGSASTHLSVGMLTTTIALPFVAEVADA
ncbi:hypothetical protein C5B91_20120 [Haloferax sp. Atlit-10N]|uniref:hypothetical protein n=1 Tax=unclassified Haloferax TaxID=2625095 RepID=UPI000E23AC64|nr:MULTISPECIES: hypothetical protein [unclassified Haloferax]RDZ39403.1 hypothetical protein C5B87_19380 [Haloferax sp. Atlit-16N]RDZ53918.1 hypothetical protein C5B91_20120 [Haloferax sp. Atlit-10N]